MCIRDRFLFLLKFTLLDLFTIFITAHGKANFASGSGIYAMGDISLSLSVCHTPVLCQNEGSQKDAVLTTG